MESKSKTTFFGPWIVRPSIAMASVAISEGGYGINIQVEKSKNLTIVKFTECDLNQLF